MHKIKYFLLKKPWVEIIVKESLERYLAMFLFARNLSR